MKWPMALAIIPFLVGCENISVETEVKSTNEPVVKNDWRTEIDSLMTAQEQAWNNGDLKNYMSAYIKSDSLMFVGSRGLNYGWETTLSNYQKSYPDKEAMGTLEFDNLQFKKLGTTNALVIGRWNLYRKADTLQGSYLLNWQLVDGEWKIIADHSS